MATQQYFKNAPAPSIFDVKRSELPQGFLAAMRLNALQRGVKWIDTYELTSHFSKED